MEIRRILTVCIAAILIPCSFSACSGREPNETDGGTDSPGYSTTEKRKTPTPQKEFDSGKYPGNSPLPEQNPNHSDNGAPRYPVDTVADPMLEGYSDLSALYGGMTAATPGVNDAEGAVNLFDGYESSKYCVLMGESVEVIWAMDREVTVSAYALVTGNDTAEFPERNPSKWELYGSADGSESGWQLIDSLENAELPAENYAYKGFAIENPVTYRFFRILFLSDQPNAGYIQLSELRLYTADPAGNGLASGFAPAGSLSLMNRIDRSTLTGPAGVAGHGLEYLFDNRVSSGESGSNKYCVGGTNITVEWKMTEPCAIREYLLFTANDAADHPMRNPVRWTLYGSADGKDYVTIHEVGEGNLPLTNYTPTVFATGCTTPYAYYRMELHAAPGADCVQLSEISLYGIE